MYNSDVNLKVTFMKKRIQAAINRTHNLTPSGEVCLGMLCQNAFSMKSALALITGKYLFGGGMGFLDMFLKF